MGEPNDVVQAQPRCALQGRWTEPKVELEESGQLSSKSEKTSTTRSAALTIRLLVHLVLPYGMVLMWFNDRGLSLRLTCRIRASCCPSQRKRHKPRGAALTIPLLIHLVMGLRRRGRLVCVDRRVLVGLRPGARGSGPGRAIDINILRPVHRAVIYDSPTPSRALQH